MINNVIVIIFAVVVFLLIEHIPYWRNLYKNFILRMENERLETYLEFQKLCLSSEFKLGQAEHDMLSSIVECKPSLPFFHVIRIIFDKKYRESCVEGSKKLSKQISGMPENAKSILSKIQSTDIKLVIARYPFAFMVLFIFVLTIILRTQTQTLSDSENVVSELLLQKDSLKTMPAAA